MRIREEMAARHIEASEWEQDERHLRLKRALQESARLKARPALSEMRAEPGPQPVDNPPEECSAWSEPNAVEAAHMELNLLLNKLEQRRKMQEKDRDIGHVDRADEGKGWPQLTSRWLENPLPGGTGPNQPKLVQSSSSGTGTHFTTGPVKTVSGLPSVVVTSPKVVRGWETTKDCPRRPHTSHSIRGAYLNTCHYKSPTAMELPAHIPAGPDSQPHPFQGADSRLRYMPFRSGDGIPYHIPEPEDPTADYDGGTSVFQFRDTRYDKKEEGANRTRTFEVDFHGFPIKKGSKPLSGIRH